MKNSFFPLIIIITMLSLGGCAVSSNSSDPTFEENTGNLTSFPNASMIDSSAETDLSVNEPEIPSLQEFLSKLKAQNITDISSENIVLPGYEHLAHLLNEAAAQSISPKLSDNYLSQYFKRSVEVSAISMDFVLSVGPIEGWVKVQSDAEICYLDSPALYRTFWDEVQENAFNRYAANSIHLDDRFIALYEDKLGVNNVTAVELVSFCPLLSLNMRVSSPSPKNTHTYMVYKWDAAAIVKDPSLVKWDEAMWLDTDGRVRGFIRENCYVCDTDINSPNGFCSTSEELLLDGLSAQGHTAAEKNLKYLVYPSDEKVNIQFVFHNFADRSGINVLSLLSNLKHTEDSSWFPYSPDNQEDWMEAFDNAVSCMISPKKENYEIYAYLWLSGDYYILTKDEALVGRRFATEPGKASQLFNLVNSFYAKYENVPQTPSQIRNITEASLLVDCKEFMITDSAGRSPPSYT